MTSLSLKKHRTIRSNIRQKVTASLLGLGVLLSGLPTLSAQDDGAISLRGLRTATAPRTTAPVAAAPTSSAPAAASILRSIRSGAKPQLKSIRPPVPRVPTAAQLQAATSQLRRPVLNRVDGMQMNDVLLMAGSDETAGTITIPDLMPPPIPEPAFSTPPGTQLLPTPIEQNDHPVVNPVKRVRTTRRGVTKYFNWDKTVSIFNRRKGTSKTRKRLGLIEFYDPEDERPDVDDYDMPILLVAAQEKKTEVAETKGSEDDAGDRLLRRKLTDIQPTLAYAWGEKDDDVLPEDFYKKMDNGEYVATVAPRSVLQWEPTNLWYYPLYFEDVGLERYGHTRRPWVQPFVSTGKFFAQTATLPYRMALAPPKCPQYALGYYQPGEWAPKKRYQMPFNEEAAATQFLWMTALILIIP